MLQIHLNDEVLRTLLFHVCVLVAKTLAMEFLVRWQILKSRMKQPQKDESKNKQNQAQITERIERIKRAQLNDIENIPVFIVIAFVYIFTQPDPKTAILLFRGFTFARIAHTLVYAIWVLPQPARGISFLIGEIITWYMIITSIIFTCS